MSKCYNCGCEIDPEDKTRLCDKCKKIILPFVKFMDASTSSAVRRLIRNESNLRNAGVTDGGMEYLLKICEIHDKKKIREREERDSVQTSQNGANETEEINESTYSEIELPMDEPLDLIHKQYGTFLPAAEAVLCIVGVSLAGYSIYSAVIGGGFDLCYIGTALASFAGAYAADCTRKLRHDVSEIKKRFR